MILMHFLSFALFDGRQILLTVCQTIVGAYMVDAKTCVNWTSEWMKLRPLYFVLLLFLFLQRIHNGIHEPYFAKLCLYQIYSMFEMHFHRELRQWCDIWMETKFGGKKHTLTNHHNRSNVKFNYHQLYSIDIFKVCVCVCVRKYRQERHNT